MKTQKLLKCPKAGQPMSVQTVKGGCWYFAVRRAGKLSLIKPFVVHGKPFREYGSWRFRLGEPSGLDGEDSVLNCSYYGILPHKDNTAPLKVCGRYGYLNWDFTPDSIFLDRTFRYTAKVWNFYKDLVDRQDMKAYKEAIKAIL